MYCCLGGEAEPAIGFKGISDIFLYIPRLRCDARRRFSEDERGRALKPATEPVRRDEEERRAEEEERRLDEARAEEERRAEEEERRAEEEELRFAFLVAFLSVLPSFNAFFFRCASSHSVPST